MLRVPEKYRVTTGIMGSDSSYGNVGAFYVPIDDELFVVIASNEKNWEHVSISLKDRCPTWDEMCKIKDMFWDDEDAVYQIHPPKSEYVNLHPNCLHLWRSINEKMPRPPKYLVGLM